ncbi:MAG: hydrogenase formation protein HypD, partial [Schwartzia sp.]|nr:hydrogenase formation protein HypD [Schwartzia sp. (in: firmicutes)]
MTEEGKQAVAKARAILENYKGKKLRIMEVCGTHTHAIFKAGLRQ